MAEPSELDENLINLYYYNATEAAEMARRFGMKFLRPVVKNIEPYLAATGGDKKAVKRVTKDRHRLPGFCPIELSQRCTTKVLNQMDVRFQPQNPAQLLEIQAFDGFIAPRFDRELQDLIAPPKEEKTPSVDS